MLSIKKTLTILVTLTAIGFGNNCCMELDIFDAISRGDAVRVQELVTHNPTIINQSSRSYRRHHYGRTPLQHAAASRQRDIAEFLIVHGANIHQRNSSGETALYYAALHGDPAIVQLLLEHGANINQITNNDLSPLQCAIRRGNSVCAGLLIEHHANVNQRGLDGWAPLHEAAGRRVLHYIEPGIVGPGETEIIRLLVAHGANIRQRDDEGYTPSQRGVYGTHVDLIDALRLQQIARTLAMVTHPRLGTDSQLAVLPQALLHYISQLASWEEQREDRAGVRVISARQHAAHQWCVIS